MLIEPKHLSFCKDGQSYCSFPLLCKLFLGTLKLLIHLKKPLPYFPTKDVFFNTNLLGLEKLVIVMSHSVVSMEIGETCIIFWKNGKFEVVHVECVLCVMSTTTHLK